MKITRIEFTNYKAFYGAGTINFIDIPNGENLLIYGENGSGKSSIYEGLRNLFLASDSTSGNARFSRHLAVSEFLDDPDNPGTQIQQPANIKIKLDDFAGNEKEIIFGFPNENVTGDIDIFNANKTNTFLSYRELLKTYLISDDVLDTYKFQTSFAELIIKDILAQTINVGNNRTYIQNYNDLWVAGRGTRPNRAEKEEIISKFDIGFRKDIEDINVILKELLNYFFPELNFELKVENSYIDYETQNYPVFQVSIKNSLFGMDTSDNDENHLTILNEARLSALALCIFLAGVIIKNKSSNKIKLLFLDDIFIGLDTSNRIPLLKILNVYKEPEWEERTNPETSLLENVIRKDVNGDVIYKAEPFFKDFQIFVTTYDFSWFETAKFYLDNRKWLSIEMYSHLEEGFAFEKPLIFTPSIGYYEKAEIYFKKRKEYKDYPAAANYLRKEFESQLKRLLYGNYLLKKGDKGTTVLREELGDLISSFKQMWSDLEFDYTPFENLELYSKTTLNPFSHDNLSKPIFKRELKEAFELVDKLRNIEKKIVINKDEKVTHETNNVGVIRTTTLKFDTDILSYEYDGVKKITPIYLKPIEYIENGNNTDLKRLPICKISKAYDMIHHNVFHVDNASNGVDVNEEFIFNDGKKVSERFI